MGHNHKTSPPELFTTKELTSRTWPDFMELFEKHGGVWGGCWCMFYHTSEGWGKRKAEQNRSDKRDLVRRGKSHGVLVYCSEEPVGWCQFGPADELPRIDRKREYTPAKDDAWRITCFFVDRDHRRMGVTHRALAASLNTIREMGAKSVEAYPVLVGTKKTSASFLWSGTSSLFEAAGFVQVRRLGKGSALYRRDLSTWKERP